MREYGGNRLPCSSTCESLFRAEWRQIQDGYARTQCYMYVSMALLCIHAYRWTHGKLLGGSGKPWEPLTNKAVHSHSVRHADRVVHPRAFARKLEAREGLNRTLTLARAKENPADYINAQSTVYSICTASASGAATASVLQRSLM